MTYPKTHVRHRKRQLNELLREMAAPVIGEQLMRAARSGLGADLLDQYGVCYRGDPHKPDVNGMSPAKVYDMAMMNNVAFFDRLAKKLNKNITRPNYLLSQRIIKVKDGKARPLDVPSQAKRLYAIVKRETLKAIVKLSGVILPTVVAYREVREFDGFKKRSDGVTIQDVYASVVLTLVVRHGPFVVSLDLHDAFGNLPHRGLHAALKELGLPRGLRHDLIDLARIRTRQSNGTVLLPHGHGIEQGNPLSPLLFNLVMSLFLRKLRDRGVQGASFGDDVVLPAATESQARDAFQAFFDVATGLGFPAKDIRPIGTGPKDTQIIDTRINQLELIKTFLLGKHRDKWQIALTPDKERALKEKLLDPKKVKVPCSPTLAEVRSINQWKVASKSYLYQFTSEWLESEGALEHGPATKAQGSPIPQNELKYTPRAGTPTPKKGGGEPASKPEVDMGHGEMISKAQDSQCPSNSDVPDRRTVDASMDRLPCGVPSSSSTVCGSVSSAYDCASELGSTTTASSAGIKTKAGGRQGERVSVSRGGPDPRVTKSEGKDAGKSGHRPPASKTVLSIRPADLKALQDGRSLRGGDNYRGQVIDLTGLRDQVPEHKLPWAVGQLLRVGSLHRIVRLLIHPGGQWTMTEGVLGDALLLRKKEHHQGQILVVSTKPKRTRIRRKRVTPPPPVGMDLVVEVPRRGRLDARCWSVGHRDSCGRKVSKVRSRTMNKGIAEVEVVARVLSTATARTVAIPARPLLCQQLLRKTRVRQVSLAEGVEVLRRWSWRQEGVWLGGVR